MNTVEQTSVTKPRRRFTWSEMTLAIVALGLTARAASAGGLLEQLPPDGAWVRFDTITSSTGPDGPMTGSLTMSSVGVVTVDGVKCRWIEFKRMDKPDSIQTTNQADAYRTEIIKFLVPERFLTPKEKPLEHVLKVGQKRWIGHNYGDEKAVWTDKPDEAWWFFLHLVLPGPLTDVRNLPKVTVETKLGKLNCAVVSGQSRTHAAGPEPFDVHSTFETQLHKQAPFGVVAMRVTVEVKSDGNRIGPKKLTLSLKLADAGTNAKSELPEQP